MSEEEPTAKETVEYMLANLGRKRHIRIEADERPRALRLLNEMGLLDKVVFDPLPVSGNHFVVFYDYDLCDKFAEAFHAK